MSFHHDFNVGIENYRTKPRGSLDDFLDPQDVYFFHWKDPAFPTSIFSGLKPFGGKPSETCAFDDVTKRNLKLFFHSAVSNEQIEKAIRHITEKDFELVERCNDRCIFCYRL